MNIRDVLIHLLLKQPFYGYIAASLTPTESKDTKTVMILTTPCIKFIYNKEWFEGLKLEKAVGIINHELLHMILLHPYRKGNRDHNLWTIACDMAVNEHIDTALLPDDAITVDKISNDLKYNIQKKKSAEYYYDIIIQDDYRLSFLEGENDVKIFLKSGQELTASKTIEGDSSELNKSSVKSIMSEIVEQAQFEGDAPSGVSSFISEIYKPNEVNWRNVLKRFLSGRGKAQIRKTCKKESKRFEDLPGNKRTIGVNAILAIDESGSISDKQIDDFFKEVVSIKKVTGASINVVQFDTECSTPVPIEKYVKSRNRIKNGGTDYRPVFKLADKMKTPLLIIFTDGEGTVPENVNQKVIWAISGNGKSPAEFGYCINL